MTQVTQIAQQVDHINAECAHGLQSVWVDKEATRQAFESIHDAAGAINDLVESLQADHSEKVNNIQDEIDEKDDRIEELERDFTELQFSPASEYSFDSFLGKMAIFSDNLGDDQVLNLFSILASNIKPADLHDDLRRILSRYPDLVKRQALEHFVIT